MYALFYQITGAKKEEEYEFKTNTHKRTVIYY